MRAFLKGSEGCFQLKSYTTTIGSHRGADIVLQVRVEQLSILKRVEDGGKGRGCAGVLHAKFGGTSFCWG